MLTSWRTEKDRLVCGWSRVRQQIEPDVLSMPGTSESDCEGFTSIPDFAGHSPFGSGEWYVPWNIRWSVAVRQP